MSFFGAAECSTAGNPLSQFTKHVHDDKTLQRERLVNHGPNGAGQGFRTMAANGSRQDETMNGFLQQAPTLPEMPLAMDSGFGGQVHIDPNRGVHLRANTASPSWAEDMRRNQAAPETTQFNLPPDARFSPAEFARFSQLSQSTASSRSSPLQNGGLATPTHRAWMGPGLVNSGMGFAAMPRPMYQAQLYPQLHDRQEEDVKGKGKAKDNAIIELDEGRWEEQFAQIELEDKQARDNEGSQAVEAELNKMDEQMLGGETGFGDLESIWRGIQAGNAELGDFGDFESPNGLDWNSRLGPDPVIEEYRFEEENLFREQTGAFEEGVRIMDEGGNLSLAALAFEAAVQQDPDHVEAWVRLGSAQAQNEKEDAAIRALEHALKLDPNNAPALMGLAVSYTNEGYDSTAYRTLERWLSVTYPQIVSPTELSSAAELGFTDRQQLHERVTDLFIRAAQLSPGGEHMDPDVQVGLGVLFYGAEDYDKAVDCFASALASSEQGTSNQRSEVHLLWNRLGATLANSGRSEDAIQAYEKALALRPNFVRARYNLGVSCINIGCHDAAAGHLLAALNMHKAVEKSGRERAREILSRSGADGDGSGGDETIQAFILQNQATTLHETLKRVFTQMGRPDLAQRVNIDMDPEHFRGEFDF